MTNPTTGSPDRAHAVARPFPAAGGHVTVRVVGFHEQPESAHWVPDLLGRFEVVLARSAGHEVSVRTRDGRPLGQLPRSWARMTEPELWKFERAGVQAVARATLSGPRSERDLCVLLAWPQPDRAGGTVRSRRRYTPSTAANLPVRTAAANAV